MTDQQYLMTEAQRDAQIEHLRRYHIDNSYSGQHALDAAIAMLQYLPMVSTEPVDIDAIAVNLMRLAGLEKHQAREIARLCTTKSTSLQVLKPLTADDITYEMYEEWNKIFRTDDMSSPCPKSGEIMAAAYNAVILHSKKVNRTASLKAAVKVIDNQDMWLIPNSAE